MSYSNVASYTQTLPLQHSYPQEVVYTPTGGSPGRPQQHQLRPMYFITRSNGSIVPLIPADELPYTVRLEGAPRIMSPEQTAGMQFLGSLPYTGMVFKTKKDVPMMQCTSSQRTASVHYRQYNNGKRYMAPDAFARQASANADHHSYSLSNNYTGPTSFANRTGDTPSPPVEGRSAPNMPLTDPQAIIDAIVSSKSGAETAARVGYVPKPSAPFITPSGKIPDVNKKTHCSYWIRTGECDYAPQGCMYKHEMPDEQGLLELGFPLDATLVAGEEPGDQAGERRWGQEADGRSGRDGQRVAAEGERGFDCEREE